MPASRADSLISVLRCLDLTSLEEDDTDERIAALCRRAVRPGDSLPHVAAVCVFPRFVPLVRERLAGTGVLTAAAAGAFPSGRAPVGERLAEVRAAVEAGAEEIDTVMDHAAFLSQEVQAVADTLAATREVCRDGVILKVILETGALRSPDAIRSAAELAIVAGADFVKSSTGKAGVGVTLEAARVMMEAVGGHRDRTGRRVGVKLAGGIRTAEDALRYVALVEEILGEGWIAPETFRIGASSLADDLVAELRSRS